MSKTTLELIEECIIPESEIEGLILKSRDENLSLEKTKHFHKQDAKNQGIEHPFCAIPQRWITCRDLDFVFNTRTRLLIYLWIRSHAGRDSVRFTSDVAQELGIERNKVRELRRLEATGLVSIRMDGRLPVVQFVPGTALYPSHKNGAKSHKNGA